MPTATGSFEVKHWNEVPYEEFDEGTKLTRAEVEQTFMGDIAGDGLAQWLMSYRKDGNGALRRPPAGRGSDRRSQGVVRPRDPG